MKIEYKTLDGIVRVKDFVDVKDFIRQQDLEVPALDDSAKVKEVTINGAVYDFKGNIADLYFKLSR